jgi:hypothetical protein
MLEEIRDSLPAPTAADIQRVEGELGVRFPQEYVEFISRNNGGCAADNDFDIPPDNCSDVHDIIPLNKLVYERGLLSAHTGLELVPIIFDSFGNSVCMSMSGHDRGSIYFCDHESLTPETPVQLAPSLNAFLEGVRPYVDPDEDEGLEG